MPRYLDHVAELAGVVYFHLQKQEGVGVGQVRHLAGADFFQVVLGQRGVVGVVGHEAQRPDGKFLEHGARRLGHLHARHPQLERARDPRGDAHHQNSRNEQQRDVQALGAAQDGDRDGVDEHQTGDGEPDAQVALPVPEGGDGNGHRRTGHEGQHAGGIGAGLGVYIGAEGQRDHQRDHHEHQHQRAIGAGPVRGHAVPGQIAWQDVQQARHRARTREPQDGDGADVVDGAERLTQVLVGQVRQRPPVGVALGLDHRDHRCARGRTHTDEERNHRAPALSVHREITSRPGGQGQLIDLCRPRLVTEVDVDAHGSGLQVLGVHGPRGGGLRPERRDRNEQRGHQAARHQKHAHDQRGCRQQLLAVADAAPGLIFGVTPVTLDERHHHHAGLEARQAQRQSGKDQQRRADQCQRAGVAAAQQREPVAEHLRVGRHQRQALDDHHRREAQIDDHDHHRDADGLLEATQKNRPEQGDQDHGDQNLLSPQGAFQKRVLDQVGRGVGGRQRDGDHKSCGDEADQDQHQQLAGPETQQPLQHTDAAVAVRAFLGHPAVHRQRPEQRDDHQHQRGERRQRPGGQRRDARLIPQRRKVVHPGQAHHLPPRMGLVPGLHRLFLNVKPFLSKRWGRRGGGALQQPAPEG